MSSSVFPALPGLMPGVKKSPVWSTIVQRSASLREVRTSLAAQALYNFELPYEFLRLKITETELQTLMGFVNSMLGSWDSFLYMDPDDKFAYNQLIGVGDGSNTDFQLTRTYGGVTQNVAHPKVSQTALAPMMWNDDDRIPMWPFFGGTSDSSLMWLGSDSLGAYTINSSGLVTFTTPPPADTNVYWSGYFYYKCRFANDVNEFQQELPDFYWSMSGLQFVGSIGNKI